MGQARTLTRKIVPASVELAKRSAAKRAHKYWHASERLRQLARVHGAAKLTSPNRES